MTAAVLIVVAVWTLVAFLLAWLHPCLTGPKLAHAIAKRADLALPPAAEARLLRQVNRDSRGIFMFLLWPTQVLPLALVTLDSGQHQVLFPCLLLGCVAMTIGYVLVVSSSPHWTMPLSTGLLRQRREERPAQGPLAQPAEIPTVLLANAGHAGYGSPYDYARPGCEGLPAFPKVAGGLPVSSTEAWMAGWTVPYWPSSGGTRIAHLRTPSLAQVFVTEETVALGAGVVAAFAAAGWGLWRASAGGAWWAAGFAALILSGGVFRWRAKVVLNRPSSATNILDLGWEDFLRFRAVRSLALCAAWGSAGLIAVLDAGLAAELSRPYGKWANSVVYIGGCTVGVTVWLVFKRGSRRWREAWDKPTKTAARFSSSPPTAETSAD